MAIRQQQKKGHARNRQGGSHREGDGRLAVTVGDGCPRQPAEYRRPPAWMARTSTRPVSGRVAPPWAFRSRRFLRDASPQNPRRQRQARTCSQRGTEDMPEWFGLLPKFSGAGPGKALAKITGMAGELVSLERNSRSGARKTFAVRCRPGGRRLLQNGHVVRSCGGAEKRSNF